MGIEWFALIVPILLSVSSLLIWKHKITWFEVALPILVSIGIIALMKNVMISSLTEDVEYLSEYPIEVRHYEPWNEYIHLTCTRSYSCGTAKSPRTCTQIYDCSYVKKHPESCKVYTNVGNVYNIKQSYYNYFVKMWSNQTFVDMHRDYHSYDGDMYKSKFDGVFDHIEPYTYKHTYENKTQAASNVFKFIELDTIKQKHVYDYPEVVNRRQKSCLGCSPADDLLLQRYNSMIGRKHEIKMFVLVLDGPAEYAELQRSHWKGGNKNEIVVCVGKDNSWATAFSWSDDKRIEVEANDIFVRDITMHEKLALLEHSVEEFWQRKHFSDFEYITVPLKQSQLIWVFVVTLLVTIGIIIFNIKNDIDQ